MKYKNPIIVSDYSDPDVIRVKNNFYMIASSFNYVPGVPILKSKNLVDWKLVNYIIKELPFKKFEKVRNGQGAWAPSIRYYNGLFYALIPFPDEGIYVSVTHDVEKEWSKLTPLLKGKGFIDPCPIWTKDKRCFVVFGFAKSRIGFNSALGLIEVSPDLKRVLSKEYKIIYDGHKDNPTIEGPKFNYRNSYYYIMAPAGGVKTGWQTCLRSKNIYGPYESKIVLAQGSTIVNGPHQGALFEIDDNDNWAFIHFQDKNSYGRIIHLQKVTWKDDWPLIGNVETIPPSPYIENDYIINKKSKYRIKCNDNFKKVLSPIWQTPANRTDNFFYIDKGLVLLCLKSNKPIYLYERILTQKIQHFNFCCSVKGQVFFKEDGDEFSLIVLGKTYAYISLIRENNKTYVTIKEYNKNKESILLKEEYRETSFVLKLCAKNYKNDELVYKFGINKKYFRLNFIAEPGFWVGAKIGIFAKGIINSTGSVKLDYFKERKL